MAVAADADVFQTHEVVPDFELIHDIGQKMIELCVIGCLTGHKQDRHAQTRETALFIEHPARMQSLALRREKAQFEILRGLYGRLKMKRQISKAVIFGL